MDTEVGELLERARVAHITGESLDMLEQHLHDRCFNASPSLADVFHEHRDALRLAYCGAWASRLGAAAPSV